MTALIVFIVLVSLDRISKYLIIKNLSYGETIKLFGNFLKITRVENPGGIFGFFPRGKVFFLGLSIVAIGILLFFILKHLKKDPFITIILTLLLSGVVGNLLDRVIYGSVIDFIHVLDFPVFNLSDSYITIGIIIAIFYLWKKGI